MNRIFKKILWACVFLTLCVYAQAQDSMSVISGRWAETPGVKLNLYEFKNGALQEIASSTLDGEGRFGFAFYPPSEGFYVIGTHVRSAVNRYVFYLKPGDNFQFEIEGTTYHLVGNNTPENREMEKWHNLVQPLETKAVYFFKNLQNTYKEFFPELESALPKLKAWPAAKTSNKRFNQAFEDYKRFNVPDIAVRYLNTPRSVHPSSKDFIDYYRQLSIPELSKTSAILTYPNGIDLLSSVYYALLRADTSINSQTLSERMNKATDAMLEGNYLANDTVKGEFMLENTARIKTYEGIMDYKNKYEKYLVTDDQKRRFRQIIGKYDNNSEGHEAIDFKFRDINGKEVALSDFKGKVVYIDVWATWCGPCKKEIPYMAKLEEEYAGNKNIVFMGVSIDAEKDIEKWKAMVSEKNMKGVQLFAGEHKADISGPYKINAIPRFMLVGKDGKMINGNAPRPSSDEIRPVLNGALKR